MPGQRGSGVLPSDRVIDQPADEIRKGQSTQAGQEQSDEGGGEFEGVGEQVASELSGLAEAVAADRRGREFFVREGTIAGMTCHREPSGFAKRKPYAPILRSQPWRKTPSRIHAGRGNIEGGDYLFDFCVHVG